MQASLDADRYESFEATRKKADRIMELYRKRKQVTDKLQPLERPGRKESLDSS